jgi:hypothetical protein
MTFRKFQSALVAETGNPSLNIGMFRLPIDVDQTLGDVPVPVVLVPRFQLGSWESAAPHLPNQRSDHASIC